MLQIHRLNPGDAAAASRWDAFVYACPQATFFHRAAWLQVMGAHTCFYKNEEIVQ